MKFADNRKAIKITSITIPGLLAVLTFALIPINIFCANFPERVTVLLSVLFCGGLIAYLIIFKTKLVTKIILPIIFGIIAMICSFLPYMVPYWNSYAFKSYNGVMVNYDAVISYKAYNPFCTLWVTRILPPITAFPKMLT